MNWSSPGRFNLNEARSRLRFAQLVRPHVGLISRVIHPQVELGAPDFELAAASLGNLTMAFSHISKGAGKDVRDELLGGSGGDTDLEAAWTKAVVEAAERYATMVYDLRDFTTASATELGEAALDFATLPRCSALEYADPQCPLVPPQPDAPVRWVRGYSLTRPRPLFVPAVMTHLFFKAWPAERFWFPISTGVAAHTNLASALVSSICESVERDSIALTWLARLPLPRIRGPVSQEASLRGVLDRIHTSHVEQHCFDATTDVGIPTVFSVQVADGHPTCELFVSCATNFLAAEAFAKSIKEASTARIAMTRERSIPGNVADFVKLTHGADYYGRGGHRADFDFMLRGASDTSLEAMQSRLPVQSLATPEEQLNHLVRLLKELKMEAVAIDLTTDELRDVGLWVVRVVIPALMPMSCVYRARFLGTPRLFDYAQRVGIRLHERDIHPGPMPFA